MSDTSPSERHSSAAATAGLLSTADALARFRRKPAKEDMAERKRDAVEYRNYVDRELTFRLQAAVSATDPLPEQLLRFWANHFSVSMAKARLGWLIGPYEREVLRPRLYGRFQELLLAAETHPAMLSYLDNSASVGPQSVQGKRLGLGLNENLAREVLELHTLGVRSGYTQRDVTELAKVLSGWRSREEHGAWVWGFHAAAHEPGSKTVLGKHYAEAGAGELEAVFADLARHPATARFICGKLAAHFLADQPPAAMTAEMEAAWKSGGGELGAVYRVLRRALDAPDRKPSKIKTPEDLVITSLRDVPGLQIEPRRAFAAMREMGQPIWEAASPAGWPDRAADWLGPDATWRRIEWAVRWSAQYRNEIDFRQLAEKVFGRWLTQPTRDALGGAESQRQALALFLSAPEFQRR